MLVLDTISRNRHGTDIGSAYRERFGRNLHNPARLVATSLEDCVKLLTVIARADRFNEGLLGSMIESGQVVAILKRIRDIRDASDQDGA